MHSNLHQTWVVCDIICVFWLAFIWKRNSVCRLLKINRQWWKIAVPKCQIFIRPFVFSKTIRQVKAGQNKKILYYKDFRSCAALNALHRKCFSYTGLQSNFHYFSKQRFTFTKLSQLAMLMASAKIGPTNNRPVASIAAMFAPTSVGGGT